MRRFATVLLTAFFESLGSVTLMTALGLIATLLYTTSGASTSVILICVVIAVIAMFTIWYQVRRPFIRLWAEEKALEVARSDFEKLTEEDKVALEKLDQRQVMPYGSVPDKLSSLGFARRDNTSGTTTVHPYLANIVPRLLNEWRAKTKNNLGSRPAQGT